MLMPTSSEFVNLCRAQISLLTEGLGASVSVIYLTQELGEGAETQLIPIVAHPDTAIGRSAQVGLKSLPTVDPTYPTPRLLPSNVLPPGEETEVQNSGQQPVQRPHSTLQSGAEALPINASQAPQNPSQPRQALITQRKIVLPLIYENVMMGLLVTERNDRAWNEWEQSQIHQIAETVAIACVMDQRYQWLHQNQQQQQLLQVQQHDILDNLLHQFRNSLTALQTFSKLILKRLVPGDANRDIAASMVREATRLRELSQQLEQAANRGEEVTPPSLSLPPAWLESATDSRQTEGMESLALPSAVGALAGAPLELAPVSVATVLEPLLASAGAIAQERQLSLEAEISPTLPPVQANAQSLREVLNNLIENALKYTQRGGYVLVQARVSNLLELSPERSGDLSTMGVEIAVSDTGSGIPAQDIPHIFERRFRGVQATGNVPGSGLGLAIARSLVEQMHGKIQVFSPSRLNNPDFSLNDERLESKPGTTFTVWLPLAVAD